MKRIFSFMAGTLCGIVVGGVAALLLTPASGEDLWAQAEARWQSAKDEAQLAMNERRRDLETQFDLARHS